MKIRFLFSPFMSIPIWRSFFDFQPLPYKIYMCLQQGLQEFQASYSQVWIKETKPEKAN
jgi:hypothetical protein